MPFRRRTTSEPLGAGTGPDDSSFTELLKRLGSETGELVRAEVSLAKLEFREIARQAALDGVKVGAAAALAFVGVLALLAWGILGLGDLLGGHYGTAALAIGLVLLVTGGVLARSGIRGMKRSRPEETVDTLKESGRWVVREARETRQALRADAERQRLGGISDNPTERE